ncbi:tyrosine-protein phosphatase MSG5, partial [Tremellales sp. Uapishka_1]
TTPTTPTASTSTSTSASTSPYTYARPLEPYADGPIELIPGVFLGAEHSVTPLSLWARGSFVRVMNVAQEIPNPFDDSKGEGRVNVNRHELDGTRIDYCHLKWSHGEAGLAVLLPSASVQDVLQAEARAGSEDRWGFWNAIQWMEEGRRAGQPVLIHCQCGVSRSATLAIAYLMALAATGVLPDHLGHLSTMQGVYDYVKAKSRWIGPNVSLVYQLLEFQKSLTGLLESYPEVEAIRTSFPKKADTEQSEAEWARRRKEFEDSDRLDEEAKRLDEEMKDRIRIR